MAIKNPCDSRAEAEASLDAIASALGADPAPNNPNGPTYKMLCPLHNDTNPSVRLSLKAPNAEGKVWVQAYCWVCQDPAWKDLQEALIRPLTRGSGGGGNTRGYPNWTETCVYESSVQPGTIVQSLRYDYPGIEAMPLGCPVVLGKDKQDEWIFCGNEDPHKECRPGRDGKPISSNGLRDLALHVHLWKPQDADAPAPPQYDPDGGPLAIVCEGEKAAQHLQMAGYIAISSYGGAGKAHHSCWDRVAGYQLIGWPDHDGAGLKFWNTAGRLAEAAGATVIGIVEVDETCAKGYDAADMFNELGAGAVRQAIVGAPWYVIPEEDEAPTPGGAGDSRPSIIGIPDNLEFQIAAAEQALLRDNGTPIEPILYRFDDTVGSLARDADGNLIVQRLTPPMIRRHMARTVYWWKPTKGGGETETWPPPVIAQHILDLPPGGLPPLSGVRFAPCLRQDWSLANEPGYDAGVKAYLSFSPPERVAINRAKSELMELVGEFPFEDESDIANWFAMLLTPILRPAVGNVPLALIGKPQPRTGATLLAHVTAQIVTGGAPVYMQLGRDDEETAKSITSAGLSPRNRGVMLLDNLNGELDRPALAAFLTAELGYDTRRLGRNDSNIHLPAKYYTVLATANNLALNEELVKRAFPVRLNAKSPEPESRTFAIPDISRYVAANRQRLLSCAWSLVEIWHLAGCPPAPPMTGYGGFEAWRDTCAAVLHFSEIPGFLRETKQFQESTATSRNQDFIQAWWDAHKNTECASATLMAIANGGDGDEPKLSLSGRNEKAQMVSLGKQLQAMSDRQLRLADDTVVTIVRRKTRDGARWSLAVPME